MIDDLAIDAIADKIAKRFERVNTNVLQKIGKNIAAVKGLRQSDLHKIVQLYNFGTDSDKIIAELARESTRAEAEVRALIKSVAKDSYLDASMFYKAAGIKQIPFEENGVLQQYIKSLQDLTHGTFSNYSNTSVIGFRKVDLEGKTIYRGLKETYQDTIDQAVTELSMGVTDVNSAMRSTLTELADSGLRVVDYASGSSRRLDSAVRQNILDTLRDVAQGVLQQAGKEFGANGVELSAHATCAMDHLPYQGRQYSNAEYDKIQSTLRRQIGQYNCRHIAYPIIMGVSEPAYTEEELSNLENLSSEKLTFEGAEYTRYEATQIQRKIETAIRYSKDRANIAAAAGDDRLRRIEQGRINQLKHKYQDVCKTFGLPYKSERMSVSGFKPVKAIERKAQKITPPKVDTSKNVTGTPKSVLDFEKSVVHQSYESAGLYSPDGILILMKDGNKHSVFFTDGEVAKMKGNILTHNHPSGSPFSKQDLDMLAYAKLKEIRAAGKNYTYSMGYQAFDETNTIGLNEFNNMWVNAILDTQKAYDPNPNLMSPDDWNSKALERLAELSNGLWKYKRIPYGS